MKHSEIIIKNYQEFLKFLKNKLPVYHNSNVFFRDIHYGVIHFLNEKEKKAKYSKAESIAGIVIDFLEKEGILKKIDSQTWMLNYPEFLTPRVEKKTSAAVKV